MTIACSRPPDGTSFIVDSLVRFDADRGRRLKQGVTRFSSMKKIKLATLAACLAIALFLSLLWLAGSALSAPVNQTIGTLPSDLHGQSVQFSSQSGSLIHGWLLTGQKGAGVVVLMHSVRSNRLSMVDRARFLSRTGYSVLLFDFQAHGESPGQHITFGYLESKDAQAAVQYIRDKLPDEKIGVIGVSMGGAAALLASPPLDVKALVLEMVYPTIDEAIADRFKIRLGAWGEALAPLLSLQLRPRLGVSANQLRPIEHVASLREPKLFIVGAEDQHTTLAESKRMYDAASEPKEIWVVDGAAHTDLHARAGAEYERRVLAFLRKNLRS